MPDQPRRHARTIRNRPHGCRMKPALRNQIKRRRDQILAATFFTFPAVGAAVCHREPFLLYNCLIQAQYETELQVLQVLRKILRVYAQNTCAAPRRWFSANCLDYKAVKSKLAKALR